MTWTALYLRISRTDTRLGVERQLASCTKLAESISGDEIRVYEDNDTTAADEDVTRDDWQRLLDDVRAGRVGHIVGWHQDRLWRLDRDFAELKKLIKKTKTPIYCATQGLIDLSNASGALVAGLVQQVSLYEIEHAKERMLEERTQRLAAGKWNGGKRPYGYDVVKLDSGKTKLVVNRREAAAIRRAAKSVLAGVSLRVAARTFGDELGITFLPTSLRSLLLRPSLAGIAVHRGEVVGRVEWKPILDEQTHLALVAMIKDPSRRAAGSGGPRKYIGGSLYVCGRCGSTMTSASKNGAKDSARYVCRSSNHLARTASYVDGYVIKIVKALLNDERVIRHFANAVQIDTSSLLDRRAQLEANQTALAGMVSSGLFTAEQARAGATAARAEIDEIERQLAAQARQSPSSAVFTAAEPDVAFDAADLSVQRMVLDSMISVTIMPQRSNRFERAAIKIAPKLDVELPAVA